MYKYIFTWIQNEKGVFLTVKRIDSKAEDIEVKNILTESKNTGTFAVIKMIVSEIEDIKMIEPKIVEYVNDYFKWEKPTELKYNINHKDNLWAVNLTKVAEDNIKEEESE